MATLWNKGTSATEKVEAFTVGDDRILDRQLARYDVQGSKAHIAMLESIGLLSADELQALTAALDEIAQSIEDKKILPKNIGIYKLTYNILCLGERVIGVGLAKEIIDIWLDTEFQSGRHLKRINMIDE